MRNKANKIQNERPRFKPFEACQTRTAIVDVPNTAWRERAVDPPFSNNSGKLACTARRLIPMHADWK